MFSFEIDREFIKKAKKADAWVAFKLVDKTSDASAQLGFYRLGDESHSGYACGSVLENFGVEEVVSANFTIASPLFSPEWRTVVDFLKPGDKIYLRFVAENNNFHLDNAGLSFDQLKIHVVRQFRGKDKLSTFVLATSIDRRFAISRPVKVKPTKNSSS